MKPNAGQKGPIEPNNLYVISEKSVKKSALFPDSLNSSCKFESIPVSTSFISLVDAAITYFNQTTPLNSSIFAGQKAELEKKNQKALETQTEMLENLKHLKKNCESLRHQICMYDKALESQQTQYDDLNIETQEKELELKKIQFEILHLKGRNHDNSMQKVTRNRRNTNDFKKEDADFWTGSIKLSEESEDALTRYLPDLEIAERFNTYH
ncbi:hypothetical protein SteCoe_3842 [Stentor coeruleus]|uniref:Uncharacterized protein n=1 Tax=Stentor coeruleus TaxID=5963 RepID=A0A1R2CW93_9CILI|nr:hypothetical protein SteCoe_3842 [Stentor coeruleus]